MFSDELQQWEWDETTAAISSKTAADVERALSREHLDIDDFMALISPAAGALSRAYGPKSQPNDA